MNKPAMKWLRLLSAMILAAVLTVGCSSATDPSNNGRNSNLSTSTEEIQPAESTAGEAASPTSTFMAQEGTDLHTQNSEVKSSDTAQASGTPIPASVASTPLASSKSSPSAEPAASMSAKPSGGSGKTTASSKPASTASSEAPRPSPSLKPAATPTAAPADSKEKVDTVTLSIVGYSEYGVILAPTAVEIQSGDSVMDLLKRITRKHKIQMEFKGIGSVTYVQGIDNLYEYDKGAESGWMYRVNGEFPSTGAGGYTVAPGDQIEWLYTLDLGKDLGAKGP